MHIEFDGRRCRTSGVFHLKAVGLLVVNYHIAYIRGVTLNLSRNDVVQSIAPGSQRDGFYTIVRVKIPGVGERYRDNLAIKVVHLSGP